MTARIRSGEGSLGKLLNDPAMANSLTGDDAESRDADRAPRTAAKAPPASCSTTPRSTIGSTGMTEQLRLLATNLNSGEGTAGQLLRDKQLYENMNQTVGELRGLIAEIRKDPKKYLNVKVSLF